MLTSSHTLRLFLPLMALESASAWIPSPTHVFEEVSIIAPGNPEVTVRTKDGQVKKVKSSTVLPGQSMPADGVADMVVLENLHDASILECVDRRFNRNLIYTYTGSILISVNPFKPLPLYTPNVMQSYNSKPLGSAPPHIYAIADTAYRALNTENADQAVLISGESGSGKTEAKKLILEYLASVASKEAPPPPTLRAEGQDDDDEEASEPEPEAPVDSTARRGPPPQEQVMAANPILEAFGNAKTLRNHNSSRFGNLCEVQFDEGGFLIGASLKHYLLEKTRVTVQSPGERNFHVFYYVCSGADKNERERWRIGPATDYNYINRSGCIDIPQLDSRIEFGSLKRALAVAGISPPEQQLIFNLIAALLHLGNTTSFFTDDLDVATLSASGQQNAQWVAYLLQCDPVALMQGMLYRENIINNETFAVPLTRAQAFDAIDSLARQLYGRQFDWLVRRLDSLSNVETQPELNLKVKQRISLLDIFGFEVFDVNSFEQFCINFANEVLQLQFNNYIFKLEQQEYAREGLRLEDFTYQDNKPTIDLFSKRPVGMMMLLDEECRFPRSSDQSYVTKLVAAHEKHPNFKKHRFNQNMFNVVHFAGEVEYTVNNFLEKNRETLSNLFVRAIKSSTCPYYAGLVADVDDTVALRRKTQGAQFQEQLGTLMTHLGACSPHYVRCIKPNRQQVCDVFERDHVLRQLRYAGVLETVRIRGAGFPNRRLLPAFLARYCPLVSLALQQRIGAALVGVSPLLLRQEADAATAAALSSGAKPKAIEGALDAADDVAATSAAAAAVVSAQLTDSQRVQLSALATEVLRELNVKPGASCVGKTKVFVRDAAFHALEGARNAFFFQAAARIQARWRGFTLRRYFLRQRQAVRYLQQWLRYYLTTQDRTAEVEGALKTISGKGIGGSNSAAAVKQLESLCKREKNVETVIEQGGIGAIVNAMGSAQGKTDDERREMLTAGTRALGRMAISQENAALVARGGAVRSMLRTIDSVKDNSSFQGATRNAVQLIDHLSKVDKNVEVVVREGGVATLTSVLRAAGGAQKGSEDEQGNSMTSAAKALGTLTKNERVARVLGRDHEAIKTVIDSINSKPKFSSLVSYSINCLGNMVQNKHNLDSVVECGGIETVIRMMELHPDSDKVYDEASRTLQSLASRPEYATTIAQQGGVDLLMKYVQNHPEDSASALKAIQVLCASSPEARRSLVACDGLETLLQLVASNSQDPKMVDALLTTIYQCSANDADGSIARRLISSGAPKIILEALRSAPQREARACAAIGCLEQMAAVDRAVTDSLRGDGAVSLIAAAMEFHPDSAVLRERGAATLSRLADNSDLVSAMDVVGRSQVEEQSTTAAKSVAAALAVIGNLALLEDKTDYIVSEGGIPVLLSLVNGISASAVWDPASEGALASGQRALGRLLTNEGHVQEYIACGGVQSLVAMLKAHKSQPRILDASIEALERLGEHDSSIDYLIQHQGVRALITAVKANPELVGFNARALGVMSKVAASPGGADCLFEEGAVEASVAILNECPSDSALLASNCQLLQSLCTTPARTLKICTTSAMSLVGALNAYPSDPQLGVAAAELLSIMVSPEVAAATVPVLRAAGAQEAILSLLQAQWTNPLVLAAGTAVLAALSTSEDRVKAIEKILELAAQLRKSPNATDLMEEVGVPVALLANLAAQEEQAALICSEGGLKALRALLTALQASRASGAHESILEACALALTRLACIESVAMPMAAVGDQDCLLPLIALLRSHSDYEQVAARSMTVFECMLATPALATHSASRMLEAGLVEEIVRIIALHPLNDQLQATAAGVLARLCDTRDRAQEVLKRGGAQLLPTVLKTLSGTEEPLAQALAACGTVAARAGDASFLLDSTERPAIMYSLLKSHGKSDIVAPSLLQCIAQSAGEDGRFATAFMNQSNLAEIKDLLRQDGSVSPALVARAARVIESLAKHPACSAQLMDRHDMVQVLLPLLSSPALSGDAGAQTSVLRALTQLTRNSDEACNQLLDGDAAQNANVARVMAIVREHSSSLDVVGSALALCGELTRTEAGAAAIQAAAVGDVYEWAAAEFSNAPTILVLAPKFGKCEKPVRKEKKRITVKPKPAAHFPVDFQPLQLLQPSSVSVRQLSPANQTAFTALLASMNADPSTQNDAVRVLSLADAVRLHPTMIPTCAMQMFSAHTVPQLVALCANTAGNVPIPVQLGAAVALSYCADSKPHAMQILQMGGGPAMATALRTAVDSGWGSPETLAIFMQATDAASALAAAAGDSSFLIQNGPEGDETIRNMIALLRTDPSQLDENSLQARHAAAQFLTKLSAADPAFAARLCNSEFLPELIGCLRSASSGFGDPELYRDMAALVESIARASPECAAALHDADVSSALLGAMQGKLSPASLSSDPDVQSAGMRALSQVAHNCDRACVQYCTINSDDQGVESSVLRSVLDVAREHAIASEDVATASVCFCAEMSRLDVNQPSIVHAGAPAMAKWAAAAHPNSSTMKALLPMVSFGAPAMHHVNALHQLGAKSGSGALKQALMDVMHTVHTAGTVRHQAHARAGEQGDDALFGEVARVMQMDPSLAEAAARVQALADALLADPEMLSQHVQELFDGNVIAELLKMARTFPDMLDLQASIAAVLSFCANTREHATEIIMLGGDWMFSHGCRACGISPTTAPQLQQLLLATGYVSHMAGDAAFMLNAHADEPCTGLATLAAYIAHPWDEASMRALIQCLASLTEDAAFAGAFLESSGTVRAVADVVDNPVHSTDEQLVQNGLLIFENVSRQLNNPGRVAAMRDAAIMPTLLVALHNVAFSSSDTAAHSPVLVSGMRTSAQMSQASPEEFGAPFCKLQEDDTSFLTRSMDILRAHADVEDIVAEILVFGAALSQLKANRSALESVEIKPTCEWAISTFPQNEVLPQLLAFFDFAARDAADAEAAAGKLTVEDALADVLSMARKVKDKQGGRQADSSDENYLKSIASSFENDPELKDAAARVQALADALLSDPEALVRSIEELFESGTLAELLRMAKAVPDNMDLHASIAAILSFCADTKEHAAEIVSLGGDWMLPHGCRYCFDTAHNDGALIQLMLATGYVGHVAENSSFMTKKQDEEPCTGASTMLTLLRSASDNPPSWLSTLLQCLAHLSEDPKFCAAFLKEEGSTNALLSLTQSPSVCYDPSLLSLGLTTLENVTKLAAGGDVRHLAALDSASSAMIPGLVNLSYVASTLPYSTDQSELAPNICSTLRVAAQLAQHSPECYSAGFCAMQPDETSYLTRSIDVLRAHSTVEPSVTEVVVFAAVLAQREQNRQALEAVEMLGTAQWAVAAFPESEVLKQLLPFFDFASRDAFLESKAKTIAPGRSVKGGMGMQVAEDDDEDVELWDDRALDSISNYNSSMVSMKGMRPTQKQLAKAVDVLGDPTIDRETLLRALRGIGVGGADQASLRAMAELDAIPTLITLLNRHRNDAELVTAILGALSRFALDTDFLGDILAAGGISALMKALRAHMDNPDVLLAGIELLAYLAQSDQLKTLIGLQGGIPVVLETTKNFPEHDLLQTRCCHALNNMALNNTPNSTSIAKDGGIGDLVESSDRHSSSAELQRHVAGALNSICGASDAARAEACDAGAPKALARTLQTLASSTPELIAPTCAALGQISKNAECAPQLLEAGVPSALIKCMKLAPRNVDLLVSSVSVLAQLAEDAQTPEQLQQLFDDGSIDAIIKCIGAHPGRPALQLAAFGALGQFAAADPAYALQIIRGGVLPHLFAAARMKTTEKELLELLLKLLVALAADAETASIVVEQGAPKQLFEVIHAWPHDLDMQTLSLMVMGKLTGTVDLCAQCEKFNVLESLGELLTSLRDDCDAFSEACQVLMNLAAVETSSEQICTRYLSVLFAGIRAHMANQAFIRVGTSLLAALTLFPSSARLILDAGGVNLILECLRANKEYPALLAKLVRVLPNFMSSTGRSDSASSERHGASLIEGAQARSLIDSLRKQHPQNVQLTKASEFLDKRITEIMASNDTPVEAKKELSLRDRMEEGTRNMLLAGSMITQHRDGQQPRQRLVRFTDRLDAFIMEDPEKKKDPQRIMLSEVKEVLPGACTSALQHKVFGSKQASPECSFAIYFRRLDEKPLSFEFESNDKAIKWINGVNKILDLVSAAWNQ